MSGSKARFQSNPSPSQNSTTKNSGTRASAMGSGVVKKTQATNNATSGAPGNIKSGPVQVIFNGKIVTPQSLIPRKSAAVSNQSEGPRKMKHFGKPQTIDEVASESADRATPGFPSKANLKRNDTSYESRGGGVGGSKMNLVGKGKPVVEESVTVVLSETSTSLILAIPSFIVASDTRDVIHTDERNTRYEACIKAHHNVDGFLARSSQTKNNPLKNQNEMAAPNAFREFGSQAISYEIKDETSNAGASNTDHDLTSGLGVGTDTDDLSSLSTHVQKFVKDSVGVALVTPGCLLDTAAAIKPPNPGETTTSSKPKAEKQKNRSAVATTTPGRYGSAISAANVSEAFSGDEIGVAEKKKKELGTTANPASGSNNNSTQPSATDVNNHRPPDSDGMVSGSAANVVNTSQGGGSSGMHGGSGGMGGGNESATVFTEEDSLQILRENEIKKILSSPMLLKRLHMIERAIQQNANYRQQLDYRDLPDISPLQLLSADRMKLIEQQQAANDGLFGGSALGGKSAMNMKRTFASDRNRSVSHGSSNPLALNTNVNNPDFDGMSTHSSDDFSRGKSSSNAGDFMSDFHSFGLGGANANKIKKLFSYYSSDLIKKRTVTSMTWNVVSSDLLAVGYGHSNDFQKPSICNGVSEYKDCEILIDEAREGLVLFWSLRNPDYPEKILRTPYSVTAVEFSRQNPMILAVGLSNGDVNIYDIRREGNNWSVPIESSAGMQGSHMEPVWQLKWIVKGVERLETLVSISTDGRVLEWNLKKGLVMSTLMQLKKSGTSEGWISNSSAGLCFDFNPNDTTTYVTGTEDGSLHRCSISYNEQYLETYQNHEGPVYRVRFSNRWSNLFLSCSADWSMNLFHLQSKSPLLSMRATNENFPVNDVCWCPDNSTVFACVTVDAKLQIWDLSVSSIDPVVTVDVGLEDKQEIEAFELAKQQAAANENELSHVNLPSSPAIPSRYGDRFDNQKDNDHNISPMNRLLKNLTLQGSEQAPRKRVLTTVLFGEKNPIIAVGDDRGYVNIFRVFDPITITHLGPLQQYLKLKEAVIRQTDPSHTNVLQQDGGGFEEKL